MNLAGDALEGAAKMISKGRNANNARFIITNIIKEAPLDNIAKNDVINKYLRMISELDPNDAAIGNRLWGDMGKLMRNDKGVFNAGFIKGLFQQLEFMDDLKKANKTLDSVEKGFGYVENGKSVQRYVDIIADGGRHFEVKSYAHYTGKNVDRVLDGLGKEYGKIIKDMATADAPQINAALDKIHFVFRGVPDANAVKMIDEMYEKGRMALAALPPLKRKNVMQHFKAKMKAAKDAAENGLNKSIPDLGDIVVFQGKSVPY